MSVPYTAENVRHFYQSVKRWEQSLNTHLKPVLDLSKTKLKRQKPSIVNSNPRPFSLLRLYDKNDRVVYVVISNMLVHEPGGVGRIKVCYQANISSDSLSIDFTKPQALKIMPNSEPFNHGTTKPFLQRYIADFADVYRTIEQPDKPNKYYYLMPLYTGLCLIDYFSSKPEDRYIKPNTFFNIWLGVAKEIKKLHDVGRGHFDIKPDNIIIYRLRHSLSVYLVDFDFVTTFGEAIRPCGTIDYMAPEFLNLMDKPHQTLQVSNRQDIYSFARMLEATVFTLPPFPDPFLPNIKNYIQEMKDRRPRIDEVIAYLERQIQFPIPAAPNIHLHRPADPVLTLSVHTINAALPLSSSSTENKRDYENSNPINSPSRSTSPKRAKQAAPHLEPLQPESPRSTDVRYIWSGPALDDLMPGVSKLPVDQAAPTSATETQLRPDLSQVPVAPATLAEAQPKREVKRALF